MTTINLLFDLDLGLVTALLEGEGRLEAEDDVEVMDDDDTATSLVDKVFTEDKDNVCG